MFALRVMAPVGQMLRQFEQAIVSALECAQSVLQLLHKGLFKGAYQLRGFHYDARDCYWVFWIRANNLRVCLELQLLVQPR